jgi:hypothetical protein
MRHRLAGSLGFSEISPKNQPVRFPQPSCHWDRLSGAVPNKIEKTAFLQPIWFDIILHLFQKENYHERGMAKIEGSWRGLRGRLS